MTRLVRMRPAPVNTSAVLRVKVTFLTGVRSNSCAPRSGGGGREPEARTIWIERRAILGAKRHRSAERHVCGAPRGRSAASASKPAARRAFCSRLTRAACSGVIATVTHGCGSIEHFTSRRRSSAAKSSEARRQL